MAPRKKKAVTRLGKQPPQYRFFLNPYQDARFTRCPQCDQPMRQRKLPLVIQASGVGSYTLLNQGAIVALLPDQATLGAYQDEFLAFGAYLKSIWE